MILLNFLHFIINNIASIIFFSIVGIFALGIFFIVYHLVRFGIGIITKLVALLCIVSAIIALLIFISFYTQVQWDFIKAALSTYLKNNIFLF